MPHSVIRYCPHFNGVRLQNYVVIFSFIADVIPPMSFKDGIERTKLDQIAA